MARPDVIVALFLAVLVESAPGHRRIHKRVVNGRTMTPGEWPFMVSMHYQKPFPFTQHTQMQHICGGALIHPQWVLTAGHCVGFFEDMKKPENWKIVLGEHNQYLRDIGEQTVNASAFFTHPGFTPMQTANLLNDIALVKLAYAANLTTYVNLTTMNENTNLTDETECTVGGWGQVSSDPYGWGMYIPLRATVYPINNSTCVEAYSHVVYSEGDIHMVVDDSILCAGLPESKQLPLQKEEEDVNDACNGDSGSPIMCKTGENGAYQLAGVVSAGKGCGTGKFPGLYTKVTAFRTWIDDTIKNNSKSIEKIEDKDKRTSKDY